MDATAQTNIEQEQELDALVEEILADEKRLLARLKVGERIIAKRDYHYTLSGKRYITGGLSYVVKAVGNGTAIVDADIPGEQAYLGVGSFVYEDEACTTCRTHARYNGTTQCFRCVPDAAWGGSPDWTKAAQRALCVEDVLRMLATLLAGGLRPIVWPGLPKWGELRDSLPVERHNTFTPGLQPFTWDTRHPVEQQLVMRHTPEGRPYLFIEERTDINKHS